MAVVYCLANKLGHIGCFRKTLNNASFISIASLKAHFSLNQTRFSNSPTEIYAKKLTQGIIEPDDHQKNVIEELQRVYDSLQTYSIQEHKKSIFDIFSSKKQKVVAPQGLYIHGSVGGGKTMLMDLFFDCVQIKLKKRVHFNAFMLDVHSRIHKLKKIVAQERESKKPSRFDPIPPVAQSILDECYLLCFDEFQVTDIGDAMILKRLFTELFDIGCVVIATSNRAPDDLYKNGLQRSNFVPFIQILKDHCKVLPLNSGIDYRRRTADNKTGGTYFVVTKDMIDNPVDKLFKYLISMENDVVRPKTINIMGRNVDFMKTCGQILDSSFTELCERPLGSSDYLMLARSFHTIFIRDVPQIKAKLPSGRRFITLIDNLYDSKTKLVMSSDVPVSELFVKGDDDDPNDDRNARMLMDDLGIDRNSENATASIFTGEEEIFAFDRCISRIIEMQTQDYWNKWDANK